MRRVLSRLVALSALAVPAIARADAWTVVGSTVVYQLELTASAVAHCSLRGPILDGTCTAAGNAVTLTHGGTSLFLTFVGGTQTLDMTVGHSSTPFTLGTIEARVVGDPDAFVFPHIASRNFASFGWNITLTHQPPGGPLVTRRFVRRARITQNPTTQVTLTGDATQGVFELGFTGPLPDGSAWPIALDKITRPMVSAENADIPVTAVVSLMPEPATLALVGGGLLALGALARRRRWT